MLHSREVTVHITIVKIWIDQRQIGKIAVEAAGKAAKTVEMGAR